MIATNEAVDILRHGWQDAASTLAGDVPEVAELLQARLEMAVASDHLDERHLLDTIQEVESVTARAGSPSGPDLARRLRRTVYEYLLALDAARPLEVAPTRVDQPATALDSPMVGAEEVAALGHATRSREDAAAEAEPQFDEMTGSDLQAPALDAATASDGGEDGATAAAEDAAGAPATRRRLRLRRRQRHPYGIAPETGDAADPDGESAPGEGPVDVGADAGEPNWRFTPAAEPVVFRTELSEATDGDLDQPDDHHAAPTESMHPDAAPVAGEAIADVEPGEAEADEAEADEAEADEAEVGEAIADVEPGEAEGEPAPTFVAPRAGFHIVEDTPPHRADEAEEPPLQMPTFTADEVTGPAADVRQQEPDADPAEPATAEPAASEAAADVASFAPVPDADRGDATSDFLAWHKPATAPAPGPEHSPRTVPAPSPPPAQPLPTESFSPAHAQADVPDALQPPEPPAPSASEAPDPAPVDEAEGEPRGWGVRRHGEAHAPRRGAPGIAVPPVEDDPFENNTRLADMRRRIEERLRRKRCDEAAALLQEIAQETGGRAVAELAMNAGDRCRALGKSNAALNCYLAAARSDPVYELPLSRLADVCIDNQDTELAVSYLERIARIYRFREDDKAALRTYRRIATIAPYREDVLTLLMNAQRTGQLE